MKSLFLAISILALCSCINDDNSGIDLFEIVNGRAGVIGELDWQLLPNESYPEVNILQVLNYDEGAVHSQGSSLRLRNQDRKKDFILTAAHIFNISSDIENHRFVFFVGKNGSFKTGQWYAIHPNIREKVDSLGNDSIFIPVEYDETYEAINIENLMMENKHLDTVTIVSSLNIINMQPVKILQYANISKVKNIANSMVLSTDADIIKGMSGSPVYGKNNTIIGIVSRLTRSDNCTHYDPPFCENIIAPIGNINQSLDDDLSKYLKKIDN